MEQAPRPAKKTPLTPNSAAQEGSKPLEGHKKLNPLSSAKYKNASEGQNPRSKTKSPFRGVKTEKDNRPVHPEANKSSARPNLMPIYFAGAPGELIKKPEKNQLYQKIFLRAQQLDLEEKLKDEEVKEGRDWGLEVSSGSRRCKPGRRKSEAGPR